MEAAVDRLTAKLETAGKLFAELPNEDELGDISSEVASVVASLKEVAELWNGEHLPSIDSLQEMASAEANIADGLKSAAS